MRPFKINAYAIDKNTIQNKAQKRTQAIIDAYDKRIKDKINVNILKLNLIQQKKELLAQLQENPEAENMVIDINLALTDIENTLKNYISLDEDERESINKYFRYSYKDIQEVLIHKVVNGYIENNRLRQLFNKAFEEKLITDKPVYYIDWIEGQDQPSFDLVLYRRFRMVYKIKIYDISADNCRIW
jgi:hypothetical protein